MRDDTEWMALANCIGEDTDLFFPTREGGINSSAERERVRKVAAICRECIVKDECLDFAIANNERYGIWGGMSEKRRRYVKAERLGISLL